MSRTPGIAVCINRRDGKQAACADRGAEALLEDLRARLSATGLELEIRTIECLGLCDEGPIMRVIPGGPVFTGMTAERLDAVIDAARAMQADQGSV